MPFSHHPVPVSRRVFYVLPLLLVLVGEGSLPAW
jgi:hypothetical protein